MVKKDKKSKAAEQKARTVAKQEKKAAQKEKKGKSKGSTDSDPEDIDLEAIRADKELLLFGGEYFNGALATFFNDLFVYLIDKDEWRRITSPNSPLPRSGHAWTRNNAGEIYLFGGEFSSPKQGTFYHYNDFWKLNPTSREWSRIEAKKGPPARSGHRMTYFKHYVIMFGGFQDTSQQTKYLQDLWIYDCHEFTWFNPALPLATQKPDPRSSFSIHPHEAGAALYGGYSRVKATAATGKQTKGGNQGTRSVLRPVVHQDTWFLRVTPPAQDAAAGTCPGIRWERRKKPINTPNPARAGATQVYHKGRGIAFGGVHDVEESEEGINSEFFDTLFAWNIERNRFFQLALRRPRVAAKKQTDERSAKKGRGKLDEEELLRNLAALEAKTSIEYAENMKPPGESPPDDTLKKSAKPTVFTMPHPRFNAQLAVQEDVLYIFGGTYEHRDREYTFDEMWAIDLIKLDGVQELFKRELEDWHGSEDNSDASGSDDEDDSEDEDVSGEGLMGVPLPLSEPPAQSETEETLVSEPQDVLEKEKPGSAIADPRPHPRPFESLRDFFTRTSVMWQDMILEDMRKAGQLSSQSVKELRKFAFDQAETMWWDCREEITILEDEQQEAGIGEILSIADRTHDAGGPGRRR
ncbi:MAG: hypothetical protein Q9219_005911 [cf. Caloplaca sp. 3 TL-2023]